MGCKRRFDCLSAKAMTDPASLTLYQLVHTFLFCLKLDFELLSVSHNIYETLIAPCFYFSPVFGEASDSVHFDEEGETHSSQGVETIHGPTRV
jgi:hypothetical protein